MPNLDASAVPVLKPELPKGWAFFHARLRLVTLKLHSGPTTYDRLKNFVFKKGGNNAYGTSISDPSGTCLAMALQFKLQATTVIRAYEVSNDRPALLQLASISPYYREYSDRVTSSDFGLSAILRTILWRGFDDSGLTT